MKYQLTCEESNSDAFVEGVRFVPWLWYTSHDQKKFSLCLLNEIQDTERWHGYYPKISVALYHLQNSIKEENILSS